MSWNLGNAFLEHVITQCWYTKNFRICANKSWNFHLRALFSTLPNFSAVNRKYLSEVCTTTTTHTQKHFGNWKKRHSIVILTLSSWTLASSVFISSFLRALGTPLSCENICMCSRAVRSAHNISCCNKCNKRCSKDMMISIIDFPTCGHTPRKVLISSMCSLMLRS